MDENPRKAVDKFLLFADITVGLVADIQITCVPLVIAAKLSVDFVVEFARPIQEVLLGSRIIPLRLTAVAWYEILDLENEVSQIVKSKEVDKSPIRCTPIHICLDVEVFGFR